MKFQIDVNIPEYNFKLSHQDKILSIGSCFSENIGEHLINAGFSVDINPFGILFNPYSISVALSRIAKRQYYISEELIQHNDLYYSFDHHGKFNAKTLEDLLLKINSQMDEAHQHLLDSSLLIITLGSAWVYKYKAQEKLVANCHKIPNHQFDKQLLSLEEVTNALSDIIHLVREVNPKIKVLFTVSPVRHWKDGAIENTQSKSILHLATHNLISQLKGVYYFPSYELVIDELRDYRFYKEDMLHPNDIAVKYVWERFKESFFNTETNSIVVLFEKLRQLESHRVMINVTDELSRKIEAEKTALKTLLLKQTH